MLPAVNPQEHCKTPGRFHPSPVPFSRATKPHTPPAALPKKPGPSLPRCPSARPQPARSPRPPTPLSPWPLLTAAPISRFLPIAHARIKTSTAFTAVSQEERAWQFRPLHFLSLRLSVLMLSLPQAALPEILVAIKEKSKVIPKHLGKRTNINHISSTFGSAWKTNCM